MMVPVVLEAYIQCLGPAAAQACFEWASRPFLSFMLGCSFNDLQMFRKPSAYAANRAGQRGVKGWKGALRV